MKDKDIDKIAQPIAAKIGEPGGPVILDSDVGIVASGDVLIHDEN